MVNRDIRRQTRECAMQLLYEMEAHKDFSEVRRTSFIKRINQLRDYDDQDSGNEASLDNIDVNYFNRLVTTVEAYQSEIDKLLESASENWKIDRIDKAMLNFGGPDRILEKGLWPELTEAVRVTDKQRGFGDYLGFSLVFEGKSEAMLEVGVKPWDIACMKILVEEAGGGFFDLSGGSSVHTGSCMVTNRHLMPEFKKMFVKEKVSK